MGEVDCSLMLMLMCGGRAAAVVVDEMMMMGTNLKLMPMLMPMRNHCDPNLPYSIFFWYSKSVY